MRATAALSRPRAVAARPTPVSGAPPSRRRRGYLEARGWRILGRNVRVGRGELDLIARRGCVLAFVEVKARRTRPAARPRTR